MNTYTFPSADGRSTIHAVKWLPEGEAKAVLQITHGMVEYIERYEEFARFLTGRGFVVAGHDHIGHGASVASPAEWGIMYAEHPADVMTADMRTHFQLLRREYPAIPYFQLGHSMGSYMLRKYLAEYPEDASDLAGAIVMGTGSEADSTLTLGRTVIRLLAKVKSWEYRSKFVAGLMYGRPYKRFDVTGAKPENSWLSKDVEKVRAYYRDPKCTYRFSLRAYLGLVEACIYDNAPAHVARIPQSLPVLFVSGADDPVGNLGAGVRKAAAQFEAAGIRDVTLRLFEGDRHEILNELDREAVYGELHQWLTAKAAEAEAR